MATSPILLWQPSGGSPPGTPGTTPPVYSQAGTTQLVEDQAYVDVVFGSIQTTDEWVLVECIVVNEIDAEPLNIWPGIITDKAQAGFRMYLNGLPDSGNYYLHWAVSGINIAPYPATLYLFTGPTSGEYGVDAVFTVKLPPSTTLSGSLTVTPNDGGAGGAFFPSSVILTATTTTATFIYLAASYGARTISVTNSGTLSDPAPITFTCITPVYFLDGDDAGVAGVPGNFVVSLDVGSAVVGTVTITMHDGGGGGTFTPTTVTLDTGTPSATFTYTAGSGGTKTISVTNDGGLTNPTSLSYVVTAPFAPTDIAGLKLWLKADSLALADGTPVATWPDTSGHGFDFASSGAAPTFKVNAVNSKPAMQFNGTTQAFFNNTASILPIGTTGYTVFAVASATAISAAQVVFATGDITLHASVFMRGEVADFKHYKYDGGFPSVSDTGGLVAGEWNLFTGDWNGSNIHLWRNGALKGTTGTTLIGNGGILTNIGQDPNSTQHWPGYIAEILVYDSALSGTDRGNVEAYLIGKYAL